MYETTIKLFLFIIKDFGDGGAFPEVPIPQYPLNMGKASASKVMYCLPLHYVWLYVYTL